MQESARHTAFDLFHPGVQAAYFLIALVFVMSSLQPVLICIGLGCGLIYNFRLRGIRESLMSLRWQIPLALLIALLNPLFSASGSTELFRMGERAIYLESFAFGACMGLLLMSCMLWFSNAAQVLTSDKVLSLAGNVAPTVALLISMFMRMVPDFVRRGHEVGAVQDACTAANQKDLQSKAKQGMRTASVLMGWGMEDSLETADSMRARGWGSAQKRSTYRRDRFRIRDAFALLTVVLLGAATLFLSWVACSQFSFYPAMSSLIVWWGYGVVALFLVLPLILEIVEAIRWR